MTDWRKTRAERAEARADELEDLIDLVRGESNELKAKLAAAEKACREVDLKTVLYAHMQNERDEWKQRAEKAEAALAEERTQESRTLGLLSNAATVDCMDPVRGVTQLVAERDDRIEEGRSTSAIAQLDAALARVKEQAWRWEQHSARVAELEGALREIVKNWNHRLPAKKEEGRLPQPSPTPARCWRRRRDYRHSNRHPGRLDYWDVSLILPPKEMTWLLVASTFMSQCTPLAYQALLARGCQQWAAPTFARQFCKCLERKGGWDAPLDAYRQCAPQKIDTPPNGPLPKQPPENLPT